MICAGARQLCEDREAADTQQIFACCVLRFPFRLISAAETTSGIWIHSWQAAKRSRAWDRPQPARIAATSNDRERVQCLVRAPLTLYLLRVATLLATRLQAGPALTAAAARLPLGTPTRLSPAVAAAAAAGGKQGRPLHHALVRPAGPIRQRQAWQMKQPAAKQGNIASFFTRKPQAAAAAAGAAAEGKQAGEPAAASSPNENVVGQAAGGTPSMGAKRKPDQVRLEHGPSAGRQQHACLGCGQCAQLSVHCSKAYQPRRPPPLLNLLVCRRPALPPPRRPPGAAARS